VRSDKSLIKQYRIILVFVLLLSMLMFYALDWQYAFIYAGTFALLRTGILAYDLRKPRQTQG